jgi:hypothetical protein
MESNLINELLRLKSKNNVDWDKIFDTVFNELIPIIKSNARNGIAEFYYPVPVSLLGVPLYNIHECVKYHIKKLKENGFRAKALRDNFIALSWKHRDPNYVEPPITINVPEREPEKIIKPVVANTGRPVSDDWTAYKMGHPDFIPLQLNNPMKIFRTNEYVPKDVPNPMDYPNIIAPIPEVIRRRPVGHTPTNYQEVLQQPENHIKKQRKQKVSQSNQIQPQQQQQGTKKRKKVWAVKIS